MPKRGLSSQRAAGERWATECKTPNGVKVANKQWFPTLRVATAGSPHPKLTVRELHCTETLDTGTSASLCQALTTVTSNLNNDPRRPATAGSAPRRHANEREKGSGMTMSARRAQRGAAAKPGGGLSTQGGSAIKKLVGFFFTGSPGCNFCRTAAVMSARSPNTRRFLAGKAGSRRAGAGIGIVYFGRRTFRGRHACLALASIASRACAVSKAGAGPARGAPW
mmetsp:Transcript_55444/g.179883  ORF Transcript_55444/g.179883 Transcript_55444/m.179883 type:complete len:223 (+) Transcript_55444:223-891(+)